MIDELLAQCDRYLDDGAAPGGVAALWPVDATEPILHAHGTFSGPGSTIVTTDQMYDIASVTKLFTTALIVRLHGQGKLSIGDPCAQYLPNFRGSTLRIVDLLTHHVAFNLDSLAEYAAQFADTASLRTALLQLPVPQTALQTINYSNIQFFYLGVIAETITGKSLAGLIHDVCQELKLYDTRTGIEVAEQHIDTPPTERVDGRDIQGFTHDESARFLGGLAGHAGIFSTAGNLALFGKAWLTGAISGGKVADRIIFHNYDTSGDSPQALGWWLRLMTIEGIRPTRGTYLQSGFTGAVLMVNPTTRKVAAFVCNRTCYGRDNVQHRLIWQRLLTWTELQ